MNNRNKIKYSGVLYYVGEKKTVFQRYSPVLQRPQQKLFVCRICAQIDNWNHLYLSIFPTWYTLLRHSPLAPNFSIDPIFRKGDMGPLVHSRECGEATAVSVLSLIHI